jgi:hypothetical protein
MCRTQKIRSISCGHSGIWSGVRMGKTPLGFVLGHQVFNALLQRSGGREQARRWRGESALAQQMTRHEHTDARASLGQGKRADLGSMPAQRRRDHGRRDGGKQGIPAVRTGRPESAGVTCAHMRFRG